MNNIKFLSATDDPTEWFVANDDDDAIDLIHLKVEPATREAWVQTLHPSIRGQTPEEARGEHLSFLLPTQTNAARFEQWFLNDEKTGNLLDALIAYTENELPRDDRYHELSWELFSYLSQDDPMPMMEITLMSFTDWMQDSSDDHLGKTDDELSTLIAEQTRTAAEMGYVLYRSDEWRDWMRERSAT